MDLSSSISSKENISSENKEMFEAVFEAANEAIIVVNAQGLIQKINESGQKMFGYDKEELNGENIEILLPKKYREKHLTHRSKYQKRPQKRNMGIGMDLHAQRKNGSQFPVEVSLSPFRHNRQKMTMAFVIDITERKQSEKKVYQLSKVFEESLNEAYIFNQDNLKFLQLNNAASKNLGYTLEELQKMTPIDIKPEYTKERFSKLIQPLITGEVSKIEFESYHQRKDQSTYPVEVHLQLANYNSESFFMAIVLDITERKQREELLILEEETAQRYLQIASSFFLAINKDEKVIMINPKGCDILGLPESEIIGKNWFDNFLLPEEKESIRKVFNQLINGSTESLEFVESYVVDQMGEVRLIQWHNVLMKDTEGRPKGTLSSGIDITDRKQADEELKRYSLQLEKMVEERTQEVRESQNLYSTIARNFPEGTINVFDRDLRYVFAEGKELFRLGISSRDLIGTYYVDRLPIEVKQRTEQELRDVFDGHPKSIEIKHKDNYYLLDAVPLVIEKNNITQILVIEKNVTPLKRTQENMQKALSKERELNELKSRFVSMASHEFRTPLSTILSSASLIDRYEKTEEVEKRRRHIQRIKASVGNLTGILNDFLSLDKLEAGAIENCPVEIDIFEFFEQLKAEVEPTLKSRQTISYDHVGERKVMLDKQMLQNMIFNLLSNAIKYSLEGKSIMLKTERTANSLEIIVKDQGIGISDEDQQHLFRKFFRAKNAVNIQGTGLGLNIVKRYLDLMDGSISFESVINEGTTFRVKIPQNQ